MKEYIRSFWIILLCILTLASCEDNNEGDFRGITGVINNMPQLEAGYEYAAWLIENDNTRLINTVSPDYDGIVRIAFAPLPQHIAGAEVIFFTIEESGSNYTTPSETAILGCRFNQSISADIRPYVISQDFSGVGGSFILDSPTTSTSDDYSGLWFMKEDGTAGLDLAILDEAWQYEAWITIAGNDLSMGKFTDANSMDSQNIYGGALDSPSFPGEDFVSQGPDELIFPLDLRGLEVKITMEPNPDFSDEAFGLIIMQQQIETSALSQTNIELQSLVDQLPSGTMTKER